MAATEMPSFHSLEATQHLLRAQNLVIICVFQQRAEGLHSIQGFLL